MKRLACAVLGIAAALLGWVIGVIVDEYYRLYKPSKIRVKRK